jgi:hypothetical protein
MRVSSARVSAAPVFIESVIGTRELRLERRVPFPRAGCYGIDSLACTTACAAGPSEKTGQTYQR